ncbi:MAG: VWA domain-containing protein [Bryobacteraceae bacterium]|jgi:Ca-activated chloride channel family protein|nr:VWA domain-containing protein [Bryobacteraceae bacterium]
MRSLFIAAALLAAAGQQPVFRVDVRLVRILATVKDAAGGLVASLNREDFTVYDNGVPQELAVFERRTELPLSIALLVDTSLSTAKELRYELDSVERFLQAVFSEGRPEDAVALYSFNYEITLVSGFTRNHTRLREGLKRLRPEGGTSLYDAIYLASRDLEMREGRRVMILVTDGGDTTSTKTFHDALEAAHLADTVIYAILVMPITSDAGRNIGGENALEGLAAGTGGRVFRPQLGPALDEAFAEILSELRTQYLLAYYPRNVPPAKDRFHRVEVRLSNPNLRVLARSGYYEVSERVPKDRR